MANLMYIRNSVFQDAIVYDSVGGYSTMYQNIAVDVNQQLLGLEETVEFDDGSAFQVKVIEDYKEVKYYSGF